ncbi:dihydroorotate dehydrogenase-like protein [Methyloparacoccus murrellii]
MDLRTRYMGLELRHPLVASASPLSETLDGIRRLEDGGAAAVVLFSLFEEQIQREQAALLQALDQGTDSFAESLSYFPAMPLAESFAATPHDYLNLIRRAVESTDLPIIASLNCVSSQGWTDYARQIEQAGAHGIEINLFAIETDLDTDGRTVEQRYLDSLRQVKAAVSLPVAMKLSPFFSAMGHMARELVAGGADALVLFNRFYRPDLDIETLDVTPTLTLSHPGEMRLPLQWIALLHGKLEVSLGATRGVASAVEVIKYLLAGADAIMTTSALLRQGPGYLGELRQGLERWMEARGFDSVTDFRGMLSHARVRDPRPLERANYIRMLESYG